MRIAFGLVVIAVLFGGANFAAQGPLPGDVTVTQVLQDVLGADPRWAGWLTNTAKAPLLWGTLVVAAALAWRIAGLRGALAVPLADVLAFAADTGLRAVMFALRPDPTLVAVADPATSSGLPSTFGLVYGAMFGVALLAKARWRRGWPLRAVAGALLVIGPAARIVLGGHWTSQMLASTALGLVAALAALAIIQRIGKIRRA